MWFSCALHEPIMNACSIRVKKILEVAKGRSKCLTSSEKVVYKGGRLISTVDIARGNLWVLEEFW
jgi:hypothetical protein